MNDYSQNPGFTSTDDRVLPFEVAPLDVRGRVVHLGPMLDAILSRHAYPVPVSRLLAEAITLTALLGTALKFNGQLILQTQSNGPVSMMVVDFRAPGELRAYARFDEEALAAAADDNKTHPGELLGTGTLAMTIDQGQHMTRYQGIVELDGSSLEEVAHRYFAQSEQIPTRVRLAVGEVMSRGDRETVHAWRAGGVLIQFLPDTPERMRLPDLPAGDDPSGAAAPEFEEDEAWVEAQSILGTTEDYELTDPEIAAERLLYRLYHERGVRVFSEQPVRDQCSCSRDRVEEMLGRFTAEQIADSVEDGEIHVKCEFCGVNYLFDPARFLEVS